MLMTDPRLDPGVDAQPDHQGRRRSGPFRSVAASRRPVLGVQTNLDRVTAWAVRFLAERMPLGDQELQSDEIDAKDLLADGVLDLEAGVHLEEVRLAGREVRVRDEELDGACADIVDSLDSSARRIVEDLAHLVTDRRRRCFFDDFLVPALDRAVTVADDPARAVGVGHDLHLDVTRGRQVGLDEHGGVAERRQRLGACGCELTLEVLGVGDDAHTAATTARRCLDQQREVRLLALAASTLRIGTPALSISSLARILSPIESIVSGAGPIQVRPALATTRANAAFSERKP